MITHTSIMSRKRDGDPPASAALVDEELGRSAFLTCASRRTRHGSTREAWASPFLAAIDPALLDRSVGPGRPGRPASRQLRLL